jgi:hypothetical protein
MTEAMIFVSVGSLLTLGTATLVIATLALQNARKYVELAEARMEHLREEQARLVVILLEEHQSLKEELEREREQRLEAQRRAEWASRERPPQRQALLMRELEREQGQRLETRQELRMRQDIEHRIDELKRELTGRRKVRQEDREGKRESSSHAPKGPFEDMLRTCEPPGEKSPPTEEVREARRTPSSPEAKAPKPAETPTGDERPRLAVWHPHPDDDVSPGKAPAGQAAGPSAAPVEMFRRHYDKYLENYEGYVKLAERIYQMRDNAESAHGPLAQREWEERLRRVNDGIKRTTARLDILEEYNPELATDDRISRRASIARHHSQLQRSS